MSLVQALAVGSMVLLSAGWMDRLPDRTELGWRTADMRFDPVDLDVGGGELRLAGAWRVTSSDSRFGGIAALALGGGEFLALTDSGVVARFPKPLAGAVSRGVIGELPDGPGDPRFKHNRDSESLVKDPSGKGWWVGFENRNELWLYDPQFRRALRRVALGRDRWPLNKGIEAAATRGNALLLLPESGDAVVEVDRLSLRTVPIAVPAGRIADAATLGPGELIVVNRRLTRTGFVNSLATLAAEPSHYRFGRRFRLRLGRLDNVEAMAPEHLRGGTIRLWLMTDDSYQRPFRTLLIAVDLPLRPRPRQPPSSRSRA